jgi:hypothetical protein
MSFGFPWSVCGPLAVTGDRALKIGVLFSRLTDEKSIIGLNLLIFNHN